MIQIKAYEIKTDSIKKLPDLQFSFRQGLCLNYNFENGLLCAPHGDAESFDGRFCWLLNLSPIVDDLSFTSTESRVSTLFFAIQFGFGGHPKLAPSLWPLSWWYGTIENR